MVQFTVECELPLSQADMWRVRASKGFRQHVVEDGLMKSMDASPDVIDAEGWGTRVQRYVPKHVECPEFIRAVIGDAMFDVRDEQRWNDSVLPYSQQFSIRPSFVPGLSKTTGTLTLEPVNPVVSSAESVDSDDEIFLAMCAKRDAKELEDPDGDLSSVESTDPNDSEESEIESLSNGTVYFNSLPNEQRCRHVVRGDTRVNVPTVGWFVEKSIVHNLRKFYAKYPGTVARFRSKLYEQFANGDLSTAPSVVVDRFLEHERSIGNKGDVGLLNHGKKMPLKQSESSHKYRSHFENGIQTQSLDEEEFESIFVSV